MTSKKYSEKDAKVTNVEGLVQIATSNLDPGVLPPWWRGHCEENWELVPKVFRTEKLRSQETNLTLAFRADAPAIYPECPHDDDYKRWLFLMQHHLLPTRLLDWTSSILVAAFFAVNDLKSEEKDAAIWSLYPGKLASAEIKNHQIDHMEAIDEASEEQIFTPDHLGVKPLLEVPFLGGVPHPSVSIPILSTRNTKRSLAQHSQFTLHGRTSPLETDHKPSTKILRKIIIPARAKSDVRYELEGLGFNQAHLFQDLDNLAAHLHRIYDR